MGNARVRHASAAACLVDADAVLARGCRPGFPVHFPAAHAHKAAARSRTGFHPSIITPDPAYRRDKPAACSTVDTPDSSVASSGRSRRGTNRHLGACPYHRLVCRSAHQLARPDRSLVHPYARMALPRRATVGPDSRPEVCRSSDRAGRARTVPSFERISETPRTLVLRNLKTPVRRILRSIGGAPSGIRNVKQAVPQLDT